MAGTSEQTNSTVKMRLAQEESELMNEPTQPNADQTTPARDFEQMYEGLPPWDIGKPQPAFVEVGDEITGSVLDVGCGTGETALFFAERGCTVIGVDILSGPIEQAKRKAIGRGITVTFQQHDALKLSDLNEQYDNILDSGLFHGLSDADRKRYVEQLVAVTHSGSKLYLQCFSDMEPAGDGPRRVSEAELRKTFTDGWTIESITPCRFVVRDDIDIEFSEGGPHALFAVIRRD